MVSARVEDQAKVSVRIRVRVRVRRVDLENMGTSGDRMKWYLI